MIEIINYAIDRSSHLLAKVVRILSSFVVLIAVSFFVVLIVFIVSTINQYFFFPQGILGWCHHDWFYTYFVLSGISLLASLISAYIVSKRCFIKFMGAV